MTAPPVLIHYHIYKNAGTSMDAMLQASFGAGWGTIEAGPGSTILTAEGLAAAIEAHPEWRAVSSHQARPPVPPRGLAVIFIRHPILRARSVFTYARRDSTQPDHAVAMAGGFADYVHWAMTDGRAISPILDYQTFHLSSASLRWRQTGAITSTPEDLAEAEALLRNIGVCGVVEEFEASCARIEAAYRPHLPELSLPGAHENRSDDGEAMPLAQRLARVADELGPEMHARLVAMNALDLRLYETARQVLHGR